MSSRSVRRAGEAPLPGCLHQRELAGMPCGAWRLIGIPWAVARGQIPFGLASLLGATANATRASADDPCPVREPLQRTAPSSWPPAPPRPARSPGRRPLQGVDPAPARPRRPDQGIRTGRRRTQVRTSDRVLEPHTAYTRRTQPRSSSAEAAGYECGPTRAPPLRG